MGVSFFLFHPASVIKSAKTGKYFFGVPKGSSTNASLGVYISYKSSSSSYSSSEVGSGGIFYWTSMVGGGFFLNTVIGSSCFAGSIWPGSIWPIKWAGTIWLWIVCSYYSSSESTTYFLLEFFSSLVTLSSIFLIRSVFFFCLVFRMFIVFYILFIRSLCFLS